MSTITAGTTSTTTLTHSGDTTGSLVFKTNDTGSGGTTAMTIDTSQNVAFAKGFTVGATAAPAFSAYQSTQQPSLTANVATKLQFQTKEFDTNSNFDNTTNYRFTPTVAGYYQVSGRAEVASSVAFMLLYIYKNGSSFKRFTNTNTATVTAVNGSALVYLNGSTDYIELYCNQGGNQQLVNAADSTYFQAAMVRSA